MTNDEFWEIISQSKTSDCEEQASALRSLLSKMPARQIEAFDQRWGEIMVESYRWDLWAVAYIINGGCSDDGFEYFRAWLIGQGRGYYERTILEVERAADRVKPGDEVECESLMHVAMEAYKAVSRKPLPLRGAKYPDSPAGESWEEGDLQKRYPSLVERFW
ncbi:MAG: DUF4240 domain-containing protein [bacterium]|nr:DUF4240 domain-containing protein [bacterium]